MRNPAWVITKVIPRKDCILIFAFEEKKKGIYDVRPDTSNLQEAAEGRFLYAGKGSLLGSYLAW